ncbi:MAG: FKBP-type peptidyl-prolyl cis-trans isomerase [Phycisphaerales bacterium]|nr:FKBP-type peptidyl-prolyl cis-trans isomerase [Phycisphaerales bacterium]
MNLQITDLASGTGPSAKSGDSLSIHYRGTLEDGSEFDSSYPRGETLDFTLGAAELIKGMDDGLVGLKVGGKRRLRIPPGLGYGRAGVPGVIPPDAVLIFEVELVEIRSAQRS